MAYTQTGIVNLALMRIGAKRITSMSDGSQNQVHASAVYDYVLDEVLQEKDWYFAKTRALLGTGSTVADTVEVNFDYAYELPSDFLKVCKDTKSDTKDDPGIYPGGYDYKIEVVAVTDAGPPETTSDILCLLIDYDNDNSDLCVTYIKRQTDETLYSAQFINALAWRLAAELTTIISNATKKFEECMTLYQAALDRADGHSSSMDYLQDETGSDAWSGAGRS